MDSLPISHIWCNLPLQTLPLPQCFVQHYERPSVRLIFLGKLCGHRCGTRYWSDPSLLKQKMLGEESRKSQSSLCWTRTYSWGLCSHQCSSLRLHGYSYHKSWGQFYGSYTTCGVPAPFLLSTCTLTKHFLRLTCVFECRTENYGVLVTSKIVISFVTCPGKMVKIYVVRSPWSTALWTELPINEEWYILQ